MTARCHGARRGLDRRQFSLFWHDLFPPDKTPGGGATAMTSIAQVQAEPEGWAVAPAAEAEGLGLRGGLPLLTLRSSSEGVKARPVAEKGKRHSPFISQGAWEQRCASIEARATRAERLLARTLVRYTARRPAHSTLTIAGYGHRAYAEPEAWA